MATATLVIKALEVNLDLRSYFHHASENLSGVSMVTKAKPLAFVVFLYVGCFNYAGFLVSVFHHTRSKMSQEVRKTCSTEDFFI